MEVYTGKKFFDLKAGEELSIEFQGCGIRYVQIVAPLEPNQYIRINYGKDKATEDEFSYKYDSSMYGFEIADDIPFRNLSFLANVDVTIQLVNPRSVY